MSMQKRKPYDRRRKHGHRNNESKKKNKGNRHSPRLVSSLLRETERRAMMAGGDNNSFAARITAFAGNLVTRLILPENVSDGTDVSAIITGD